MYNLEKRIKILITKNNETIEKLAANINISARTIHNIFKTNESKTEILKKIAEYYNIDMNYFFEDVEYNNNGNFTNSESQKNTIKNGINGNNNIVIQKDNEIINLLKKENTRLEKEVLNLNKLVVKLRNYIKKLKRDNK